MNKSHPVLSKQNKETVWGTQAVFADNNWVSMVGVRRDVDVLQRERASLRMVTVTSLFVLQTHHKKMICSRKHIYLRCSVVSRTQRGCKTVKAGKGAAVCLVPSWRACSDTHLHAISCGQCLKAERAVTHTQTFTHQAQEELSTFLWFHPRLVYLQIFGSPSCGKTQNTSRTKEVRCRLCLHEVQWWVIHDLRLEDLVLIWPRWKQNAAPHSGKQHCLVSGFGFLTKEALSTNNLG